MTFIASDGLEKLEDGSEQTRRLPQLAKYEDLILEEVVLIESGKSPEQTRTVSERFENVSP